MAVKAGTADQSTTSAHCGANPATLRATSVPPDPSSPASRCAHWCQQQRQSRRPHAPTGTSTTHCSTCPASSSSTTPHRSASTDFSSSSAPFLCPPTLLPPRSQGAPVAAAFWLPPAC
ncbi:unnamed protein product [Closterium sp. NIES-54]